MDPDQKPALTTQGEVKKIQTVGRWSDITLYLVIFAQLPYQLGDAANVLPPLVKQWLTFIGAVATIILKEYQRKLAVDAAITDNGK